MQKKYLSVGALALTASLTASILFFTHSTWAADSVIQLASATTTPSPASTAPTLSTPTSTTPASTGTTAPTTAPADTSTLNLSLEDALKSVETGNSSLKLLDSKILIYDKQNQQALARHDANIPVVDEASKKDRALNYQRTQWTLDNAKHDRATQLKDLQVAITNEYEGILTLQQQAENLKKQHSNLDTVIEQVNLQINLGLKIPSDLYAYKAQISKLEAGQKAITNSINSAMNTLKQDLGIDLNREVVLTSKLNAYTKFDETDLENKIAKAVKNNYDIQKYTQDIAITQTEYDIDFYYDDIYADPIQLSVEDKKATLANLPVTKEVSLRAAYNSLKTLENTIEADKLTVEADQINIDIKQKNIDVGTSSTLEMIPLQTTLLNDQYTLQQDINAYMAAAANFQNSLEP
ncbi:TolC family protein [Desulfitobacterium sp.]|uniref:TolC family protein n=1 Tax=Desulfitobacterium sp. TaxID=49981 RepID=UPI002CE2DE1F|nr:TolC family protein [Desulfitobacterium sp.]HVJ49279.1 TolC family protein [Desulfitobacterium sp.]